MPGIAFGVVKIFLRDTGHRVKDKIMIQNEVIDEKTSRTHSQEFKREAVALVLEHGYSYASAGRSLGVNGNLIGCWKRKLEDNATEAFPGTITRSC